MAVEIVYKLDSLTPKNMGIVVEILFLSYLVAEITR